MPLSAREPRLGSADASAQFTTYLDFADGTTGE